MVLKYSDKERNTVESHCFLPFNKESTQASNKEEITDPSAGLSSLSEAGKRGCCALEGPDLLDSLENKHRSKE